MAPKVRHVFHIVLEHVDNGNHDDGNGYDDGHDHGKQIFGRESIKIAMSLPPQPQLLIISRFAVYFHELIGAKNKL